MKYIILLFFSVAFLSCRSNKNEDIQKEVIDVYNFNVIISPDLSNRINPKIHPKTVHDTVIVNDIFDQIPKMLKIGNRSSQQEDIYTFDFINTGALNKLNVDQNHMKIDFSKFEAKQIDRSNYIRSGLLSDIDKAKLNIAKTYEYALSNQSGADIFNYLEATVNNVLMSEVPEIKPFSDYIDTRISTRNVLILLTDGYIENVTKGSGYQFTGSMVKKIRKEFKNSNSKDINQFIREHPQYQINKLSNPNLQSTRIIVVEMADRSLNDNGVAIEHPTDFVIVRAVWKNWLDNSGIKESEFVPAQNTSEQTISHIMKFISKQSTKVTIIQ